MATETAVTHTAEVFLRSVLSCGNAESMLHFSFYLLSNGAERTVWPGLPLPLQGLLTFQAIRYHNYESCLPMHHKIVPLDICKDAHCLETVVALEVWCSGQRFIECFLYWWYLRAFPRISHVVFMFIDRWDRWNAEVHLQSSSWPVLMTPESALLIPTLNLLLALSKTKINGLCTLQGVSNCVYPHLA